MKILYDGDPGIDDALAILLASKIEDGELIGVTTVSGNCSAVQAAKNALNVLERIAGTVEIPVAIGALKPLLRDSNPSYHIHGSDGLGETHLPDPNCEVSGIHAVNMILKTCRDLGNKLTIVTGGPLTNIALAVSMNPKLLANIHKIVVMGGCIRSPGNITGASEFNICHDPEAAKIVFNSGIPITLVSLDLTARHENLVTSEYLKILQAYKDRSSKILYKILSYYLDAYTKYKFMYGCFMHDPLAMLIAIRPTLLQETEYINVDVETRGDLTLGRTQADLRRYPSKSPNIIHCLNIDYKKSHQIFKKYIFK